MGQWDGGPAPWRELGDEGGGSAAAGSEGGRGGGRSGCCQSSWMSSGLRAAPATRAACNQCNQKHAQGPPLYIDVRCCTALARAPAGLAHRRHHPVAPGGRCPSRLHMRPCRHTHTHTHLGPTPPPPTRPPTRRAVRSVCARVLAAWGARCTRLPAGPGHRAAGHHTPGRPLRAQVGLTSHGSHGLWLMLMRCYSFGVHALRYLPFQSSLPRRRHAPPAHAACARRLHWQRCVRGGLAAGHAACMHGF